MAGLAGQDYHFTDDSLRRRFVMSLVGFSFGLSFRFVVLCCRLKIFSPSVRFCFV